MLDVLARLISRQKGLGRRNKENQGEMALRHKTGLARPRLAALRVLVLKAFGGRLQQDIYPP